MKKLFNKILVPVDFSTKTKGEVCSAFLFAKKYSCGIHLLHVINISPFKAITAPDGHAIIPHIKEDDKRQLEFELEKLCRYIDFLSEDMTHVEYSIISGSWNQGVIDFVNDNNVDLVFVGQRINPLSKRRMGINPDIIAQKTNIPVITIPANIKLASLYSIVIPVTDFLPVRKLMYAVYMALNVGATIKLLGIENGKTKNMVQYYLEKANRLIRDNCDVCVETETIFGTNIAAAVNSFALHKSADLVILNPGTQTRMPGIFSSLLGNIIHKYASPPVLTINPA